MKKTSLLLALLGGALFGGLNSVRAEEIKEATLPAATKAPKVGKVGQTMKVEIDSKKSQDFNLDLPKGQFFVYLDAQRLGEDSLTSNIDASLYLLKRNGAEMPQYGGYLIYWNTGERTSRVGKAFSFSKPTGVRFRVKNDSGSANNFWLTVVPAQPANFLPFNFGSPVKAAKIGPNNGTGSTLEHREFEYLRAVIPAGTWSISLGAKTKEGSCYAWMDSFNARGVDYPDSISIFGVGKDDRKEKIITLVKPTTLIFRVTNGAGGNPITYDVTIEPSTD